ncbi:hypothetical protein [Actinoallomurus soli]|uniref:hypothetical protein n=1 Tax=Actinoallomurus soli TaxID=2952535 RepID=UPI0020923643|nr:hypothetical protein [Actinoallomurus soli]MCO5974951.1 hypothetical protein [Actinoallomurus soli]
MTDITSPITSKYDQNPYTPDFSGSDDSNNSDDSPPDILGNTQSPKVTVAWDAHRSFNDAPNDPNGGDSQSTTGGDDAQDFSVNFATLGSQINSMLTKTKTLVTEYESLRTKVLGSEDTVFGQTSMLPGQGPATFVNGNGGTGFWSPNSDESQKPSPTAFAEPAKKFAAEMNPHQEKALQAIGATLELVGEYIALVNYSGQVYSAADRKSKFPDPPSKGVTG